MKDRVSRYPGRVKLVPVDGQANTYDMVNADEPTVVGTPLNKASLLSDATAELFGLNASATPEDVLRAIGSSPPVFNGYATDLYLYITGQHPVLCAHQYSDYWMYQNVPNHQHGVRAFPVAGTTAIVYDEYNLERRH